MRAWLERAFAGAPIPQYEINKRTMEILHGLMVKNQERDQEAQIVMEDCQQKTEEYHAEGIQTIHGLIILTWLQHIDLRLNILSFW